MATMVGKQDNFFKALQELLELDYDAIEAYKTAIDRLDNNEFKSKLNDFKMDHQRHVGEISAVLRNHDQQVPTGPSTKQWLTKGKVLLGSLIGDDSILAAMLTNEEDTNTAYERMVTRADIPTDAILVLKNGLQDEKRHKNWLETITAK